MGRIGPSPTTPSSSIAYSHRGNAFRSISEIWSTGLRVLRVGCMDRTHVTLSLSYSFCRPAGVTHNYGSAAGAMDGNTIIAQVYSGSQSSAGSGFVIYNMILR